MIIDYDVMDVNVNDDVISRPMKFSLRACYEKSSSLASLNVIFDIVSDNSL